MTTSKDLMLAILAMDSYNRGYGAGISDLGDAGSQIGSATMLKETLPTGSVSSGIYAAACTWDGKTVISYRGTDNFGSDPVKGGSDILNGWVSATGTEASQVEQSLAFYQELS